MAKALKVSFFLVVALVIALAAFIVLFEVNTPKRDRYLIPEGYRGRLCTTYLVAGEPPLPDEDGFRVVKFDQSGIVRTSSEGLSGKLKDEFFVYAGASRRPLNIQREMGGGFTTAPADAPGHFTFMFWVSPDAKAEQPPSPRDELYQCGPAKVRE
jgi:hypothetical protein